MERTKPMNQMSQKRRDRFAAAGIDHPVSTFLPSPPSSKGTPRRADTGPDQATVDLVIERDAGSCVVCGDGVSGNRGEHWSVHHRKLRAQGVDNRPSNLILVCGGRLVRGCHGAIHGSPAKGYAGGWLLLSTDDPTDSPLIHAVYGVVLLDDRGEVEGTDRRPGDA